MSQAQMDEISSSSDVSMDGGDSDSSYSLNPEQMTEETNQFGEIRWSTRKRQMIKPKVSKRKMQPAMCESILSKQERRRHALD